MSDGNRATIITIRPNSYFCSFILNFIIFHKQCRRIWANRRIDEHQIAKSWRRLNKPVGSWGSRGTKSTKVRSMHMISLSQNMKTTQMCKRRGSWRREAMPKSKRNRKIKKKRMIKIKRRQILLIIKESTLEMTARSSMMMRLEHISSTLTFVSAWCEQHVRGKS